MVYAFSTAFLITLYMILILLGLFVPYAIGCLNHRIRLFGPPMWLNVIQGIWMIFYIVFLIVYLSPVT